MASISFPAVSTTCNQFVPQFAYATSIQLNSSGRWKKSENFHKCGQLSVNNDNPNKKDRLDRNGLSVGRQPLRAASEGLPTELIEGPKFVPLSEDDPRFGPPALLLLGFKHEEIPKVQALLKEMDGEFLKVMLCTEDMVRLSLWDAVNVQQPDLKNVKVADGLPRICFLSGLSGEETLMFIDAFPEAGLKPAVFAALVPNSAGKSLEELIEEIMGDHERLKMRRIPGSDVDVLTDHSSHLDVILTCKISHEVKLLITTRLDNNLKQDKSHDHSKDLPFWFIHLN